MPEIWQINVVHENAASSAASIFAARDSVIFAAKPSEASVPGWVYSGAAKGPKMATGELEPCAAISRAVRHIGERVFRQKYIQVGGRT